MRTTTTTTTTTMIKRRSDKKKPPRERKVHTPKPKKTTIANPNSSKWL
jgi:hypothetical protein